MTQRELPPAEEYVSFIRQQDWRAGLTAQAMRAVAQQRRLGTNWTTINCGWLNLPRRQLIDAYARLPSRLR